MVVSEYTIKCLKACVLCSQLEERGWEYFPYGSGPATVWPGRWKGFLRGQPWRWETQAVIPWQSASVTSVGPLWLRAQFFFCQRDINGSSDSSGRAHRLAGRNPRPGSGPHYGGFGSCLSQEESYKLLPQSVTCRWLNRHFCSHVPPGNPCLRSWDIWLLNQMFAFACFCLRKLIAWCYLMLNIWISGNI